MLKQWDNVAQKDYFNSFIPAKITTFSGADSTRIARRWMAKDIRSLSLNVVSNPIKSLSSHYLEICSAVLRYPFFEQHRLGRNDSMLKFLIDLRHSCKNTTTNSSLDYLIAYSSKLVWEKDDSVKIGDGFDWRGSTSGTLHSSSRANEKRESYRATSHLDAVKIEKRHRVSNLN